jgi:hypothetical protein
VLIFKPESQYYWKNNPEAWKKVSRYRKDLCNKLKIDFIEYFTKVKAKKSGFEIMLTAIDTLMSPHYEDNIAEDMEKLIWMENKYAITLQIEDPSVLWSTKPERYFTLGDHYKKNVSKKSRLVLDCNVLDNHKKGDGGLPAEKPIGEEMRQIAYNMDITGARPAFYSEETVYETDYKNINTVLARDVTIKPDGDMQWIINSPFTASIKTGKKNLMVWLNEEQWFAGEGENVIVPQGESILKFEQEPKYFDLSSLKPRLNYISCELKWANFSNNQIEFLYDSEDSPAFVIISKRPSKIFIDDKRTECKTLKSENGFSVKLPSGSRKAKIIVGGGLSSLIESSGVVLLSLIVVFGFFTSIVFLGLFIAIQIKRKLKL